MINPADYTITVKHVIADGEPVYRASVRELPHLVEYAASPEEVYALALDAIQTLYEAAKEAGRLFPAPSIDELEFSGRVTLRMPKTLHRQMSNQADEQGTSFNHYLVSILSFAAARGAKYFSQETILETIPHYGVGHIVPNEKGGAPAKPRHRGITSRPSKNLFNMIVTSEAEHQATVSGKHAFAKQIINFGEQDSGLIYESGSSRSYQ